MRRAADRVGQFRQRQQRDQCQHWDDGDVLKQQDREASKINPKMIVAAVGEEDLVYGLIRMWEAHIEFSPLESMAFRNIEDAEKWIEEKIIKP